MQLTIQILLRIDKFLKLNQATLGVDSSEEKQARSWECNRAINSKIFQLKLKGNLDSDQNKISFHLTREKIPVFSTNSSMVINRKWLFSQWVWHSWKCQWQSQETGQDLLVWIRSLGLDSHSCGAVKCLCPAVGVQSQGVENHHLLCSVRNNEIFSGPWRVRTSCCPGGCGSSWRSRGLLWGSVCYSFEHTKDEASTVGQGKAPLF